MIFFVLILFALMCNGMEIAKSGQFHEDYLSRKNTLAVKGIFVILIVFSHYSQGITLEGVYDQAYDVMRQHLNQMVVSMFLFYSGFGVMESFCKKGHEYIHTFPVRRFLTVFADFALAIFLYLIMAVILKDCYSIPTILLAFLGWTHVGNSNWYMNGIFGLYLATWLAFAFLDRLPKEKAKWFGALIQTLFSIGFCLFLMKMGRPNYCFNTLILYPAGMWFSLFRKNIEKIVQFSSMTFSLSCLACGLVYYASFMKRFRSIEWFTIWAFAFTGLILLATMKIRLSNEVLIWFGTHIFSVYILQKIPMRLLKDAGIMVSHKYMGLILVFLMTIPMAILFDQITGQMNKGIISILEGNRGKQKKNE